MIKKTINFLLLSFMLYACSENLAVAKQIPTSYTPKFTPTVEQKTIENETENKLTVDDGCISPIINFAYALQGPSDSIIWGDVFPMPPWQEVISLPSDISYSKLELIREWDNGEEIWIKAYTSSDEYIRKPFGYLIYQIESEQWKRIDWREEGIYNIRIPNRLFLDKERQIWGVASQAEYPLFIHYQDQKRNFEFVHDKQEIFDDGMGYKFLFVDRDNQFWVSSSTSVYSFDPTSQKAQQHFSLEDKRVIDATQMSNGSIYFQLEYRREFIHYVPNTGEISKESIILENLIHPTTFSFPEGAYIVTDIFSDHADRLWFHNYGWMEKNGTWYQIVDTPIFLSEGIHDRYRYHRTIPHILLESIDNLLWFQSDNGLAWLDPEKGKWCWFTTAQSNIVEDKEHNLWMIADNKLYRLSLAP